MAVDKASLDSLRIDRGTDATATHKPWWLAATAAVVVIVAFIVWLIARPSATAVRVATAHVVQGATESTVLNATGYVTARREATVSSKVTGRVVDVYVDEGMQVHSGQILAKLDDSIAQRTLHLAEAQQAAAATSLNETRVRMEQARNDMQRAASLQTQQIQSKSEFEHAQADFDALKAHLAAQQDQLSVAQRQVQLAAQDVEDCVIRAPYSGIVVSKNAQQGEMISPISAGGGFTRTGICTLVDMDSLEIEVDVAEAYIHRVVPNQKVEAVLDAYPDWRIPAHVITVIPTADRQKATVKVRIGFDVKSPRILPDMGVKVAFIDSGSVTAQQRAVVIPKAAIRHDGDLDVVFVVDNDNRAERRAVKVATTEGDDVKLASGLADGDRVVVEGPAELRDGQKVKVR